MAKTKEVREAEARLAELEATIASWHKQRDEADAAIQPARKRLTALGKAQERVLMLTTAGGQPYSDGGAIRLTDLARTSLAYSGDRTTKAKALAEALAKGEAKISAVGGVSYTLRGYLQRTRLVDKAQLAGVRAAERRRVKAQAALKAAWEAEREAYKAAFEVGSKPELVPIAEQLARRLSISTTPAYDRELERQAWGAERHLEVARMHLDHARSTNPDKGLCNCADCVADRRNAKAKADEAARVAALPTAMFDCPKCGRRHRGHHETATLRLSPANSDKDRAFADQITALGVELPQPDWYGRIEVPDFPVIYCLKSGTLIWWVGEYKRRVAKPKRRAKAEQLYSWTCPNPDCQEPNTTAIDADGAVYCEVCEVGYDAHTLALSKVKPAEKAA